MKATELLIACAIIATLASLSGCEDACAQACYDRAQYFTACDGPPMSCYIDRPAARADYLNDGEQHPGFEECESAEQVRLDCELNHEIERDGMMPSELLDFPVVCEGRYADMRTAAERGSCEIGHVAR
jgi:hypothetical protein